MKGNEMKRILITGSRTWTDVQFIKELFAWHPPKEVTLVSGNCPLGADAICEQIAKEFGWMLELHPADWKKHGKSAGFKRNKEMVDLGADKCYAFIKDGSKGATHTANLAEKAGIQTFRYTR